MITDNNFEIFFKRDFLKAKKDGFLKAKRLFS